MQFNMYQAVPPLTQEQEEELAPLARAGDPAAQDRMIRSVAPLVQSLAARACRAGVEVGDLVQAGMISVWRALRSYDPTRSRWSSWAGRHAKFDILHAAENGAPIGLSLLDVAAPDVDEENAASNEQAGAAVRTALSVMFGDHAAQILTCRFLEGLSATQTALRLRVSWRTIRDVEARAIPRLRAVLSRATA